MHSLELSVSQILKFTAYFFEYFNYLTATIATDVRSAQVVLTKLLYKVCLACRSFLGLFLYSKTLN